MRLICVGVLAMLSSSAMAADQPQPGPQPGPLPGAVTAALATPEHRAAVLKAARLENLPGAPACPDSSYVMTGVVGVLQPAQVDSGGKLQQGAWKEQVRETGCGSGRLLNVLSYVSPTKTVESAPMLPGTSIADPKLQQDSVQYAASALGGMPPGCDKGAVLDTRFVGLEGQPPGVLPAADAPPKPWTEVWTLGACSKRVDVDVHFKPDETGTEINASLHK